MEQLPDGLLCRAANTPRREFVFERHGNLDLMATDLICDTPASTTMSSTEVHTILGQLRQQNGYTWATVANQVTLLRSYLTEFREGTNRNQFLYSSDLKKWIYLHNKIYKTQMLVEPTLCFQCTQCECLDEQLYAIYKQVYLLSEDYNTPYTISGVYNLLLRTRNLIQYHIREECRDVLVPTFCEDCQNSEANAICVKPRVYQQSKDPTTQYFKPAS